MFARFFRKSARLILIIPPIGTSCRRPFTRYNVLAMSEHPVSKAVNRFLDLFRKKKPPPKAEASRGADTKPEEPASRGGFKPPSAVSAPRGADARPPLRVTSHVARDLLQNAAYFSSLPKVVAEYVTNAIDSAAPGRAVLCEVTIDPSEVTIADNGSGMTYAELSNFFQMHGENIQRKRGRTVRGRFGTGKSAAFGIADTLQIETVKGGLRNIVELHRQQVESARDGRPIPVTEVAVDQPAPEAPDASRGGFREVPVDLYRGEAPRWGQPPSAVSVPRGTDGTMLGQHLRSHRVRLNGKLLRYRMPASVQAFDFKPPEDVVARIGRAKCTLRLSPDELEHGDNTIAVLCHGFLHATTLAGRSREPLVEYIFGEVEVPSLDEETGLVPAFDNTRSLALNPQNPKVQALEAWLGGCIDEVLKVLVEKERRRKAAREQRLLRRVAGRIKSLLDEDFQSIQESLPWASLPSSRKVEPARAAEKRDTLPTGSRKDTKPPSILRRGWDWFKRLLGFKEARRKRSAAPPRGGPVEFAIRYARLGVKASRAKYDPVEGVITLNRDHPQLRTAEREAGIESNTYKMLCYDIAFTEYALAVADALARQAAAYRRPLDASALVQSILDRLGRRAAESLERSLPPETRQEG